MGQEIARIGDLITGSEVRARTAIVLSYDSRFAFQIQQNNPDFRYERHLADYFSALHNANIPVDIVSTEDDLTAYDLVIVPALYVAEVETVKRLETFVERGGTLIVTARSGVKDHTNIVVDLALPGLLARLCGVEVQEYDSLLAGESRAVKSATAAFDQAGRATVWCDILKPTTAEVLANYEEDFYSGQPAMTLNRVGEGQAIYVGTIGDEAFVRSIVTYTARLAGITGMMETPPQVEVTARWRGDECLLFILNHSHVAQQITLEAASVDLISQRELSGGVTLLPRQVMIVRRKSPEAC
jgi:beta-galactosidase